MSVYDSVLQSSSPSYLFMASLDAARAHAQQEGIWEEPFRAGTAISAALQELPGLEVLSHKHVGMFIPSSWNNASANCYCTRVLKILSLLWLLQLLLVPLCCHCCCACRCCQGMVRSVLCTVCSLLDVSYYKASKLHHMFCARTSLFPCK